jgi:ABC-type glycerol-3-phosphate transport system substrate-binding protein
MKKVTSVFLCLALLMTMAIGLGSASAEATKGVINLYSFTVEVPGMVDKYIASHPDFGWTVNTTVIATTDGLYQPALDQALAAGGDDAPDMYCAESAFVLKYTQGDMSSYAAPYADLGIDVSAETAAADIAQYTIDIGTRPSDSALVALGYQATGGALIYRRSIAKDVWGTDDPDVIATKVGPGWDQFFAAAAELKAKGYGIVSGDGDIWHAVENSSEKGWIVDGQLYIDPPANSSSTCPCSLRPTATATTPKTGPTPGTRTCRASALSPSSATLDPPG